MRVLSQRASFDRAFFPRRDRLPSDRPLPPALRSPADADPGRQPPDEFARSPKLALVEAALTAADEPLTAKKVATLAGLADGNEARRLIGRLRELYEREGSAFQVEEVAGGFQLLTRPEFHPWLV